MEQEETIGVSKVKVGFWSCRKYTNHMYGALTDPYLSKQSFGFPEDIF